MVYKQLIGPSPTEKNVSDNQFLKFCTSMKNLLHSKGFLLSSYNMKFDLPAYKQFLPGDRDKILLTIEKQRNSYWFFQHYETIGYVEAFPSQLFPQESKKRQHMQVYVRKEDNTESHESWPKVREVMSTLEDQIRESIVVYEATPDDLLKRLETKI